MKPAATAHMIADLECRFISIEGSTTTVTITRTAQAEEWNHFSPIYDRTKSQIYFATEKGTDDNWGVYLP